MSKELKKAFIGLSDIASVIDNWGAGFEENNIKTLKGSMYYQHPIQNSKLHFVIEKYQIGYFRPGRISVRLKPWLDNLVIDYYFRKAIRECDIFVFFWSSFNSDFSDYKILKEKGKKIITVFVGDDIRWEPAMKQEFENNNLTPFQYAGYDYSVNSLGKKLTFLRVAEKYSDLIFSQPNMSQLSLKPYHNLFIPMSLHDIKEKSQQRKHPVIVHAPTSIGKGTHYIEPIIERLKNEGLVFEYKRIQNVPRKEAMSIYANSDIIIDQLLLPGGGGLAHEGLAMGKVVLTLMAYSKYDQKKPNHCPLVDVSKETLYEVLKDLITNQIKRSEIAVKGRSYIEKYHMPKILIENILNHLNGSKLMDPDFYPTFFREDFIPESKEALLEYNKWNQYVADCDWYKKNIVPGEREGLLF